jgi:hypothetical protein
MLAITPKDLTKKYDAEQDVAYLSMALPDGRELQVVQVEHNLFKQTRMGLSVRAVRGWAWIVVDPSTKQQQEASPFTTRKECLAHASTWINQNPAGVERPLTE